MKYRQKENEIEITELDDFDLARIFECGQCFRWNADGEGVYTGVAMNRVAKIRRHGDSILITSSPEDFESIWRGYFDLDRSYGEIREGLCIDSYIKEASDFGAGIRILRQDKWEALCSFIISQCNNIPRIKKIIETLCRGFGDPIAFEGETFYIFPSPEKIALLDETALAPCRMGYRAPYIIAAAKKVASGALDLNALSRETPETALTELKKLTGVGDKVANCAVLFGLHMLDAFPIDVWMKRAVQKNYGKNFDPAIFSPYAGIAQQYMFFHARSFGEK